MWITRTRCTRFLTQFDIKMSHFGAQKSFCQNIQYCQLCLLIVPYRCAKFQKYLYSGFLEEGVQGLEPYMGYVCPLFGEKKSFSKYLFAKYLFYLLIVTNHCTKSHKTILRVHCKYKSYKLLGSIWVKNAPCWGQKDFFHNIYFHLCLFKVLNHWRKVPKKSLEWIQKTRCTRFWVHFY